MTINVYDIVKTLLKYAIAGTEWEGHVYTVGGCERDRLMGNEIKDIDIVVDLPNGGIKLAKWLEEKKLTKGSVVVYENYGTAMFKLSAMPDIEIEAVQTRKECYRDISTRNPETAFGTIKDDCTRRDFTYNAIYFDITNGVTRDFSGNGIKDLENNILRTCGEPEIIFNEDPLRILRAVRFATRFGSEIDNSVIDGMKKFSNRLEIISLERIQDEFFKILRSKGAKEGLELINSIGARKYVLPFVDDAKMENIISVADRFDKHALLEMRLAAILWDEELAKKSLLYLKCSNELIKKVCNIIYISKKIAELKDMNIYSTGEAYDYRKIQCKHDEITVCQSASILTYVKGTSEYCSHFYSIACEMKRNGTETYGYKLPIDGEDVMRERNIPAGPDVKYWLGEAMKYAYMNPKITRDELLRIVREGLILNIKD